MNKFFNEIFYKDKVIVDSFSSFNCVSIKIASPSKIINQSFGEVKTPETINYRTFKPENDGLFCQRIFGPVKDYECQCGKYKRIKFRGVICDRCGVQILSSKVRRSRLGHIELAIPVVHIWFFKNMPSRLGILLNLSLKNLEKIIYYKNYIVLDSGNTPLKFKQIISLTQYDEYNILYKDVLFVAKIGASAIRSLLCALDLKSTVLKLEEDIFLTKSKLLKKKISKRLRIFKSFVNSTNRPEWIVLENLPVIPPDLRPLVPLEGGRFATSDLNDLYRRVINRNNRLKSLFNLKTPEVIINNECRMLQESVDALLDNGRHGKPVTTSSNNRLLKSLSDMLRGKQGRFRQNLLGKRVDYSGRSVIVVDPRLKLYQCGIPRKMAVVLFEPFIIHKLKRFNLVHTIRGARRMIEQRVNKVWLLLNDIVNKHPILLNRAPTLHRLSIQAFEPLLIFGNAITIHPLVCTAYNADFDGDQMAIHIPISIESIIECQNLMMSVNNIFLPSNGNPVMAPSQDIVLGIYHLTLMYDFFYKYNDILHIKDVYNSIYLIQDFAKINNLVIIQNPNFKVRTLYGNYSNKYIVTTLGRFLFNLLWPNSLGFINRSITKTKLNTLILQSYYLWGRKRSVVLLDLLKELGFKCATENSISLSVFDMIIPKNKTFYVEKTFKKVQRIERKYKFGLIEYSTKHNKIIELWTRLTDFFGNLILLNFENYFHKKLKLNPLFLMLKSESRGSKQQIRQLCGIRGLMVKPSGNIIEMPILTSFKEGLSVLDYFNSTHGARKGLADTALKTADAGYLTRKLCNVAMDVLITHSRNYDKLGVWKSSITENGVEVISLKDRILGRYSVESIKNPSGSGYIIKSGGLITNSIIQKLNFFGIHKVRIMSPLTSVNTNNISVKSYGVDLSTGRPIKLGTAVGIIAAQSIGEPGTQLTMRTFHIGGIANKERSFNRIVSLHSGIILFKNFKALRRKSDLYYVLSSNGYISILNIYSHIQFKYSIELGFKLFVKNKSYINKGDIIAEWSTDLIYLFSEYSSLVLFEDLIIDKNLKKVFNKELNNFVYTIRAHKEFNPCLKIIFFNKLGLLFQKKHYLTPNTLILIKNNSFVKPGLILAKKNKIENQDFGDITGGLPKITEFFEVRKSKAELNVSKSSGIVNVLINKKFNKYVLCITSLSKKIKNFYYTSDKNNVFVENGSYIRKGEILFKSPLNLNDIVKIWTIEKIQDYIIVEIQKVYKSQTVDINDKHIEIIVSQMFKRVKVLNPGDSNLFWGEQTSKYKVIFINKYLFLQNRKLIKFENLIQGITKASFETSSFISAASFQETTRVLTEAALLGKIDYLRGFKENVILGHLIPAGTGFLYKKNL